MKNFRRSEYVKAFKAYDDIYGYVRDSNLNSARWAKKRNISHTPFAWEEIDEVRDVPSIPSHLDWTYVLSRNIPRPADPPKFQQKHARFVDAYREQLRERKNQQLKQNVSPKGSTSASYVRNIHSPSTSRSSSKTSVKSMPTDMPSRSKTQLEEKNVSRKGVQTSEWKNVKEKGSQANKPPVKPPVKVTSGGVSTVTKTDAAKKSISKGKNTEPVRMTTSKTDAAIKSMSKTQSVEAESQKPVPHKPYIVCKAKDQVPPVNMNTRPKNPNFWRKEEQPFTGFGYGNNNLETAKKMTANVKSPCDVYPSSLRAAKVMRRRQEVGDLYDPYRLISKPGAKQWTYKNKDKIPTWRRYMYESEYKSNYQPPNMRQVYIRREQNKAIAKKAQTACGILRKPK